jgi:hypothetical protein
MNCSAPETGGKVRIEPPPANVAAPCDHPSEFLSAGDWELIASRIGDALIYCGRKHEIMVERDVAIREAVSQ